jgi:hypothetical protein
VVAFHEELDLLPTIAGESMFRNKIPEARRPGCLCNVVKSPIMNNSSIWTALKKFGTQKALKCRRDLRKLCGRHESAVACMMSAFAG